MHVYHGSVNIIITNVMYSTSSNTISRSKWYNNMVCYTELKYDIHNTIGSLLITVTPSGTVPVCSGDQLELTCNATAGSQVEWSVYSIPENETIAVRYYGRRILNTRAETESNLMVKSVLFTFSRTSPLYDLPFVTRLVTSPINNDINGTEVVCTDKESGNYSSTTVIVINKSWVSGRVVNSNAAELWLVKERCLSEFHCRRW